MSVNLKKQRQSDFFDKGKGAHKSEFLEAVGSASILFSLKFGPQASRWDESAGACKVGFPRGRGVH